MKNEPLNTKRFIIIIQKEEVLRMGPRAVPKKGCSEMAFTNVNRMPHNPAKAPDVTFGIR